MRHSDSSPQGHQLRELGLEDRCAPAGLLARRHLAGFAPTLLQPIDPRATDGVLLGELVRRQPRVRIAQHPEL